MRTHTEKAIERHLPITRQMKKQQEKQKAKYETVRHSYTQADIDRIKKEATHDATRRVFLMMLGFPLLALRNEFGFGSTRLRRLLEEVLRIYEDFESKDLFDFNDLVDIIHHETGIRLHEGEKK